MKKILVPCDFSAPAREAFKFAVQIAQPTGGQIIVVHAAAVPVMYETTFGVQPYPLDVMQTKRLEENAQQAFQQLLQQHSPGNASVRFAIVHDYLLPSIEELAEKQEVDVIIMGTHGSSGIEEIFIGSNTEKVVRFSKVPVISVKKAPSKPVKEIAFPNTLDLNQHHFVNRVKALQEFFGARLHVLYINTARKFKADPDAYAAVEDFASHYQLSKYTVNVRNDVSEQEGILGFAHEHHADMIAMATHGRQGLAHLFSGSIAESVVNRLDCPIWTFSLRKQEH